MNRHCGPQLKKLKSEEKNRVINCGFFPLLNYFVVHLSRLSCNPVNFRDMYFITDIQCTSQTCILQMTNRKSNHRDRCVQNRTRSLNRSVFSISVELCYCTIFLSFQLKTIFLLICHFYHI